MIISHRHRFIFLKTHKTAGTSLEIALSKFCGPEDIITPLQPADEALRRALGVRGPQHHGERPLRLYFRKAWLRRLGSGRRPPDYFNHISAAQLRPRIDPAIWAGYSKFAVSRNPWDAMFSRHYHSSRRRRTRPSMERSLARRRRLIAENWSIYA